MKGDLLNDSGRAMGWIGDQGGAAMLEWARHANGLRMISIEDNNMSDQMRKQFRSLRGISVFV